MRDHLVEAATNVVAHALLAGSGFGAKGFTGSIEALIRAQPTFRKSAHLFRQLYEDGVSLKGDGHHILCSWAEVLMKRGEALPPWLLAYVLHAAKHGPPRRKRGHPRANPARD